MRSTASHRRVDGCRGMGSKRECCLRIRPLRDAHPLPAGRPHAARPASACVVYLRHPLTARSSAPSATRSPTAHVTVNSVVLPDLRGDRDQTTCSGSRLALSATKIAKQVGHKPARIKKGLAVGGSGVLAEFDRDEDAVKSLVVTAKQDPGRWDHVVSRLRQERKDKPRMPPPSRR